MAMPETRVIAMPRMAAAQAEMLETVALARSKGWTVTVDERAYFLTFTPPEETEHGCGSCGKGTVTNFPTKSVKCGGCRS